MISESHDVSISAMLNSLLNIASKNALQLIQSMSHMEAIMHLPLIITNAVVKKKLKHLQRTHHDTSIAVSKKAHLKVRNQACSQVMLV